MPSELALDHAELAVGHAVDRVDDILDLSALGDPADVAVVDGGAGVGRLVEDELIEALPGLDPGEA